MPIRRRPAPRRAPAPIPGQITRPFTAWRRLPELKRAVAWSQASGIRAWLVGGAVRDLLAGREPQDWDLAVEGDPAAAARSLAARVGGRAVELHAGFRQYRVAFAGPRGRAARHYDLQSIPAPGLLTFLQQRDFTVNALAWPLLPDAGVLDATGGLRDLVHGRLRLLPGALAADPVRALRGLRVAAELGLKIFPADLRAFRAAAPALRRASAERVRDELFRLLAARRRQSRFAELALAWVLGADRGRNARLRRLPAPAAGPAADALLAFAAAAGTGCGAAASRLKLSRREIRLLSAWDHLAACRPADREAWLTALWPARVFAPELNALAIALGSARLRKLAAACTAAAVRLAGLVPRLDGREVSRLSGLSGPRLGGLLARLGARQALGRLRTRAEAMRLITRLV